MAYKFAIADKVGVKVEGKSNDPEGKEKTFSFVLVCDRNSDTDLQAAKGEPTEAFLKRITSAWSGQQMVLDEAGDPVPFSQEAFDALLSIAGMPLLCLHSYLQQRGVLAKN